MEITPQDQALFEFVYRAPTSNNFRRLSQDLFPYFIAYLYNLEGLYTPLVVDGQGDDGVDIELRGKTGPATPLQGIAQCKFHLIDKVGRQELKEFIGTLHISIPNLAAFFTNTSYTRWARSDARHHPVIKLYDLEGITAWINQIHTIEEERRSLPRQYGEMPVPVICFSNNKGGVGKTSIVANLADAFSKMKKNVLVIDADPQANLTNWLLGRALPIQHASHSLLGVIEEQLPIHPLIITNTSMQGVFLLPAHRDMGRLSSKGTFEQQKTLLAALAHLPLTNPQIDLILIDTQPELQFLTKAAITASRYLIFPFLLDEPSYNGIHNLLEFIEGIERLQQLAPIHILGGIAMRANTTTLAGTMRERIPIEAMKHPRLLTERFKDVSDFWVGETRERADFPKAEASSCSVLTLKKSSDASVDVNRIAKEVLARVNAYVPVTV